MSNDAKELMPCPFCGGKVEMHYTGSSDWEVICETCPVETRFWVSAGKHGYGKGESDEARRRWNQRAALSSLSAEPVAERRDSPDDVKIWRSDCEGEMYLIERDDDPDSYVKLSDYDKLRAAAKERIRALEGGVAAYRAVLIGMEFKDVDLLPTKGVDFCLALGKAAAMQGKILAALGSVNAIRNARSRDSGEH